MKIAITGSTGFFGGSLAFRLLASGHEVLALSRLDPSGMRTRRAIEEACRGFGSDPSTIDWSMLKVQSIDFQAIEETLPPALLSSIDFFWHAAAEMSYSSKKLESSFAQNLGASSALYRYCAIHALRCRRFFYVSTAYTAGFGQSQVEESLHIAPHLINVYQASKWASELNLAWQNQSSRLPLTIFRPSIIIGHEESGWYGGNEFGMYSIARGLREIVGQGARRLRIDIDIEVMNNMIPINRVIDFALALHGQREEDPHCEFLHAVASEAPTLGRSLGIAADILGLKIEQGPAHSLIDRLFMRAIHANQQFVRSSWTFSTRELQRALGSAYQPYVLSEDILRRILQAYFCEKRLEPQPLYRGMWRPLTRRLGGLYFILRFGFSLWGRKLASRI